MRVIAVEGEGKQARLAWREVEPQSLGDNDVRISIKATAVNRADLLQRRGLYPPPEGAPPWLGLECSGRVAACGSAVSSEIAVGDRVMALLTGGGYAEEVVVPAGSVCPIPDGWSWEEAAAFPETFITCYLNLFELGGLGPGMTVLVHGGGGGIGTSAIVLCKEAGVRVLVTCSKPETAQRCMALGADRAILYPEGDFANDVHDATDGRGVDVVLDCVGAAYLPRNLACLAVDGRLVLIGLMGGYESSIDLRLLLSRRLQILGSTLRSLSAARKAALWRGLRAGFGEAMASGRLKPRIDRVLSLDDAEEAHRVLAAREHFGKVVLRL